MAKAKPIPRKMLGLKVPEALRNSDMLNAVVASPTARQVLAEALLAAAAAAATVIAGKQSRGAATKQAMQHVVGTAAGVMTAAIQGATKRGAPPAALLEAPSKKGSRGAKRAGKAGGKRGGTRRSSAARGG